MFSRLTNIAPSAWLVMAAAGWGLGTVMTKDVLAQVPPLTLLVTQLSASLLVLLPLLRWQRARQARPRLGPMRWQGLLALGLLGWLNPGLAYTLGLLGLRLSTASMSALLWAMEPLIIVALAWLLLRQRPPAIFVLLALLAGGGVLLAVGAGPGQAGLLAGNALILGGVLCCALYTVLAQRLGSDIRALLAVTIQQSLALIWAVLIWPSELLTKDAMAGLRQVPLQAWGLAGLSGVVYYGLAFCFFLSGLRHTSPAQAGMFINLVPFFALAGAYILLGERLAPAQWLGAAVVLTAVMGAAKTKG